MPWKIIQAPVSRRLGPIKKTWNYIRIEKPDRANLHLPVALVLPFLIAEPKKYPSLWIKSVSSSHLSYHPKRRCVARIGTAPWSKERAEGREEDELVEGVVAQAAEVCAMWVAGPSHPINGWPRLPRWPAKCLLLAPAQIKPCSWRQPAVQLKGPAARADGAPTSWRCVCVCDASGGGPGAAARVKVRGALRPLQLTVNDTNILMVDELGHRST